MIGGRKEKYSQNFAINNKLVCDIVNQTRRATVVTSVDATSFYDLIAHPVTKMTNQNFGV